MARTIPRMAALLVASLAASGSAAALEEHNPLAKLKAKTACMAVKPENLPPLVGKFRVEPQNVLVAAIGKNALPVPSTMDPDHLGRSYFDLLVDNVVPCSAGKATLEKRKKACTDAGKGRLVQSEEKRYASNDVRAIRQNLLRLFQSSVTGGTADFVVIRTIDPDTATKARKAQNGQADQVAKYIPFQDRLQDDLMLLAYLYAAERNVAKPDGTDGAPVSFDAPFEVLCTRLPISGAAAGTPKKYVGLFEDGAGPAPDVAKALAVAGLYFEPYARTPAPDAGALWAMLSKAGDAHEIDAFSKKKIYSLGEAPPAAFYPHEPQTWALHRTEMPQPAPKSDSGDSAAEDQPVSPITHTTGLFWDPIIAKSPSEFIKGSSDKAGLTVGTKLGYDDDTERLDKLGDAEVTVEGAIGISFVWRDKYTWKPHPDPDTPELDMPKYESTSEWALTPYLAIKLDAAEAYVCSVEAPCVEDDDSQKKKTISYGWRSAGLRLDRRFHPPADLLDESSFNTADELQIAGRPPAPWGYGAYIEYIGDNYNILSSELVGAYVSPPASVFGPFGKSLRRNYALDAYRPGGQRTGTGPSRARNLGDDLLSGWFFKWDAAFVLENQDYSRPPRKFDAVPMIVDGRLIWPLQSVVEGGRYGTDASFTLSKFNFHSLGLDDQLAKLSIGLVSRRGFDHGNSADKWAYSLALTDPTGPAKRTWSVTYKQGEDHITGVQEDSISFNLTFGD